MSLTARQISLVRESFSAVAPISDQAAALFYGRLFEVAPSVRPLFPDDVTAQGKKLMKALALAVSSLERPDALLPVLRDMGARHVAYGAEEAHYAVVGECLIWTLRTGLGDAFTPEVEEAWVQTYGIVSSTMIEGARSAAA